MNNDATHDRPLEVVFLSLVSQEMEGDETEDRIDKQKLKKALEAIGVRARFIPPFGKPWNPFCNWDLTYRAIDLVRACYVLLAFRRVDVVVSVFEGGGLCLLLLRWIAWFRPRILLWDASIGNPWRVLKTVQRIVFPRYDGFMMLVRSQVDYLRARAKEGAEVRWIGYRVDEDFFHPRHSREPEHVLSVGDDGIRDFDTLVQAVDETAIPTVLKTRWRPESGAEGVADSVRFVSERLDDHEYRDLFSAAALVVVPMKATDHPGGITTLFEAMAMGKAVVITESPIAEDFVVDGETGLVVPIGDAGAMREAVTRLWNDKPLCERMGRNARAYLEEHWSTPKQAQSMREFFEQVCRKA